MFTFDGFSQHLNKIGKIEVDDISSLKPYYLENKNNTYKIYYDSLVFDGNTWYDIENGFLTTLELADNKKDKIFRYDNKGQLKATILSDRIINLKISKQGNFIAWYNSENIILINLNSFAVDTLQGSFVYSFVGNEKFIYYNSNDKNIHYENRQIPVDDFPVQFVEFDHKILVCTKNHIYELKQNNLVSRHEFNGTFFDLRIVNDELFFVERREKRKDIEYRLYKTKDFNQIYLVDKSDSY
ncbi:MAG: hypothetical protein ACQERU_12765, partial [Bacteroidota bacterium]